MEGLKEGSKAYTSRIAAWVKAAGPVLYCHTNHTKRAQGRNRWTRPGTARRNRQVQLLTAGRSLAVAGDEVAQECRGIGT